MCLSVAECVCVTEHACQPQRQVRGECEMEGVEVCEWTLGWGISGSRWESGGQRW